MLPRGTIKKLYQLGEHLEFKKFPFVKSWGSTRRKLKPSVTYLLQIFQVIARSGC